MLDAFNRHPTAIGESYAQHLAQAAAFGVTMIIATHEMSFAREVADTVAFLHEGRIVESGDPDQVLVNPQRPETQQFLRRLLAGRRA